MKKSVLFLLLALISMVGFSQEISWNVKAGVNLSNFTGDDLDLDAKVGFKVGGGIEYAFNDTWSIQPSLFLSTKGAKKDDVTVNAMYLELPIMGAARFSVGDNSNIVISAGPYIAYGIGGKTKIEGEKVNTFSLDGAKKFDAGLGVGTAFEIDRIVIGLEGQLGLTKVLKPTDAKNLNFSATVGYKF